MRFVVVSRGRRICAFANVSATLVPRSVIADTIRATGDLADV